MSVSGGVVGGFKQFFILVQKLGEDYLVAYFLDGWRGHPPSMISINFSCATCFLIVFLYEMYRKQGWTNPEWKTTTSLGQWHCWPFDVHVPGAAWRFKQNDLSQLSWESCLFGGMLEEGGPWATAVLEVASPECCESWFPSWEFSRKK